MGGERYLAGWLMYFQPGGEASTSLFQKSRFDGSFGTTPYFWGVFEKTSSKTNEDN